MFCALETYALIGGLQQFNRRVIRHLDDLVEVGAVASASVVLLRDDPHCWPSLRNIAFVHSGSGRLAFAQNVVRQLWSVDLLLLGHVNLLPVAAVARLLRPSLPILLFVHGDEVWNRAGHRTMHCYEPWMVRAVTRIASVSRYTEREMARSFRAPLHKFRHFPNAVDPISVHFSRVDDPPILLTVTRLGSGDREKNVDKALRAFALLSSRMPQAIYEIVGDGVLRGELEALARELGIAERVRFLGRVDDAGLRDAYRRANVFILPSAKEGFGIVYLEAWQWALPVICSTEGASCEIVSDGVDGFVVDPDNIASLAEQMHFLLVNPEVARTFGEHGRRKVEDNYLDGAFGERLRSLLNELQETNAGAVDNDAARRR